VPQRFAKANDAWPLQDGTLAAARATVPRAPSNPPPVDRSPLAAAATAPGSPSGISIPATDSAIRRGSRS
jgi:hypothetical protein